MNKVKACYNIRKVGVMNKVIIVTGGAKGIGRTISDGERTNGV